MNTSLVKTLVGALIGCVTATLGVAWANTISGVRVDPAAPEAGKPVKIVIEGQASNCGLYVDYGDGYSDNIKIGDREGTLPRELTHAYAKPGHYTLKVVGKKITTRLPCDGSAQASLTVAGKPAVAATAPSASGAAATATCPEGWRLLGKVARDGSFRCAAQAPAAGLNCPGKLKSFEKDGVIGCGRAGK